MSNDMNDIVERVMPLWDQKLDTVDIAKKLGLAEQIVDRAVRVGLERRRGAK